MRFHCSSKPLNPPLAPAGGEGPGVRGQIPLKPAAQIERVLALHTITTRNHAFPCTASRATSCPQITRRAAAAIRSKKDAAHTRADPHPHPHPRTPVRGSPTDN
ncbi:hypothetical protein LBMAG46_30320 [Planctomycetia bacterium]|nr:hypothetical protein LBMAG46_30320 [Planctomycetia bacterium]